MVPISSLTSPSGRISSTSIILISYLSYVNISLLNSGLVNLQELISRIFFKLISLGITHKWKNWDFCVGCSGRQNLVEQRYVTTNTASTTHSQSGLNLTLLLLYNARLIHSCKAMINKIGPLPSNNGSLHYSIKIFLINLAQNRFCIIKFASSGENCLRGHLLTSFGLILV